MKQLGFQIAYFFFTRKCKFHCCCFLSEEYLTTHLFGISQARLFFLRKSSTTKESFQKKRKGKKDLRFLSCMSLIRLLSEQSQSRAFRNFLQNEAPDLNLEPLHNGKYSNFPQQLISQQLQTSHYTANPFPVMKTGFSLEVFLTGKSL